MIMTRDWTNHHYDRNGKEVHELVESHVASNFYCIGLANMQLGMHSAIAIDSTLKKLGLERYGTELAEQLNSIEEVVELIKD